MPEPRKYTEIIGYFCTFPGRERFYMLRSDDSFSSLRSAGSRAAKPDMERGSIPHSMLIVSGHEQFASVVRNTLPRGRFMAVEYQKNAAAARRCILERYYDIVVINLPLPDEAGMNLALDISEKSNTGVLVVVPEEMYEDVLDRGTDYGILAISKPTPRGRISKSVRYLIAVQDKIRTLEKKIEDAREKTEELRLVDKAKFTLVENEHMTEAEAHRYIGKQSMNEGISRRRIAERILDEYE